MRRSEVFGQPGVDVRALAMGVSVLIAAGTFTGTSGLLAQQAPATAAACSVSGTITGLGGPLPGVSITLRKGETVQTATSTGVDGTFRITLPDASYQLTAELTGFDRVQKDVTISKADACAPKVDLTMALAARTAPAATASAGRAAGPGGAGPAAPGGAGPGGPGRAGAPGPSGEAAAAGQRRFETLAVQQNAATASLDPSLFESQGADALSVAPAGFGSEAVADAFAVTGDAARVDRGLLNERRDAINRGDFNPNFDPRNDGGFGGGNNNFAGLNNAFGGNNNNNNGRGGRGNNNNGNFNLGGRGGRQNRIQGSASYQFRGSALEAPRKQLRSDVPLEEKPYSNHNYSFTVQGPVKIPGIFRNENNSTNVMVQYSGQSGGNLFDQYATVPTDSMRAGDFSSASLNVVDPQTGLPFPGNLIPVDRMSAQSLALLNYYPAPNLPGTTRNYHYSTTTNQTSNQIQARIQHNFNGQQAGGNGRGGNGNTRSNAGLAGRGQRLLGTRTNVNMNLNVQFQRGDNEQANVFTTLGGTSVNEAYSISPNFNIQRGRTQHQLQVNYNHSGSQNRNRFAGVQNVSGLIGIEGISDSSFGWGLPRLSFSSISGLSDVTPSKQSSDRVNGQYSYRHPFRGNHQVQMGGDFRYDITRSHSENNANGAFVFTGLYSGLASNVAGLQGLDFADFLLGYPSQASIAAGPGEINLRSKTMGLFIQDDWRVKPNLTLQLGVRYDLLWPFTEKNGHLVNLDVTPGFTAAEAVEAGGTGEFTGSFPKGLVEMDANNISPKIGAAFRAPSSLTVRTSYEVNYNNNTYAAIARQLAQQPPFATTGTNIGGINNLLLLEDALTQIPASDVTNNYGIDKNYVFGTVHQGVINVQRPLHNAYQLSAQYTHSRGYNLDIVRAPNRDASGVKIDGVQPFTWTSSEGRSILNSGAFEIQKRQSRGIGWRATYTIASSHDNSPSIGGNGGGTGNVAQDDKNVAAEWAQSSFIQRHQLQVSGQIELPFGPSHKWLYNGGFWAALAENWQLSPQFTARSGRPYSIIVRGAAKDIATGLNGAVRADYNGADVGVSNPTIDQWFNTSAFSIPGTGLYGTSPRNIVLGPGSRDLNLNLQRNVRMSGNRSVNIQMRIQDLLNSTNYSGIDTNVNSKTFGQITGVSGNRTANLQLQFRF